MIIAYLSFDRYESFEIVCSPEVVDSIPELVVNTLNRFTVPSLKGLCFNVG